jgi:hypothetical protein
MMNLIHHTRLTLGVQRGRVLEVAVVKLMLEPWGLRCERAEDERLEHSATRWHAQQYLMRSNL